jgi:S1-C subfamily serine protease
MFQIVIAIGNPFALTGGPTVTAGIVSSLNRKIQFGKGASRIDDINAKKMITPAKGAKNGFLIRIGKE